MNEHPLILVDGSSWLFRAFHALPPLTSAGGEPSGAIYGIGNMLRRLQKEYAPRRICVVFDPPGPTFRDGLYAAYKATRSATPEDLTAQYPQVVELIEAMALPVLSVAGYEADDVIGTLTKQARARGEQVLIVSSDKDLAQLVDEGVWLLDTMKNRTTDVAGVIEKFGVPPERIIDYLALVGDTSDNIPGIAGVGPKTAAKWLTEFGSLDGVIENAARIGGKAGDNLRAGLGQLPLARQLATLHCEVPLPVALDDLVPGTPDRARLARLYKRYGFQRWLDELGAEIQAAPPTADPAPAGAPTEGAPQPHAEPAAGSPATESQLVLDEAALEALAQALDAAELAALDTETDSLDSCRARLVGLSFAVREGHGWYLPLAHDYLGAPPQLPWARVRERLGGWFADAGKAKVGQHFKYDMNVLARHGVEIAGLAYDTMLESYVLDAAGNRHDMDTLAEKHLGHTTIRFTDIAGRGKSQLTFNQIDLAQAAPYSAEDADITLRLHRRLYPKLAAQPELCGVFETLEMPLVPVLSKMERRGVKVDTALLAKISAELGARMADLQARAFAVAGTEFNLGSPKQLQKILFEDLGLRVVSRTAKGDASTAEDVLEELAAEHELPRLILDWRGVQKLRSTYADNLGQVVNPETGRIHTSYHQAVAATGRLSSSDPNLQNIPVRTAEGRRIRQAFVAEPGRALLSIDYSQIELRLMAHFSGDEKLVDAYRSGRDVHQATAAEVFGVAIDTVTAEQRRAAKAINFGLIYGMSSFGLARALGIGRGEAADYIERFFGRYPGVKRYMEASKQAAREQGYVATLYGRRLYLPNINARNQALRGYAERNAINAPLQGTAADLIKAAMIDLERWLADTAPEIEMIMQVHDELVFEGPTDALQTHAAAIAARMCAVRPLTVPLAAEWGIGPNWDAAHQPLGAVSPITDAASPRLGLTPEI